jgi:hypothetical protein
MGQMIASAKNRLLYKLSQLRYRDVWWRRRIAAVLDLGLTEKQARGIARTVRLLGNFPGLWQRTFEQTPRSACQWGRTLFVADGPADHYVILNSIFKPPAVPVYAELSLPGPERVWGLHMEPEDYVRLLHYDRAEEHALASRFYTSSEYLLERGGIYRPSPPYVHFHVGRTWDALTVATPPRKTTMLGIIVSDIDNIDGHKIRRAFLERLDASGIDCVIWGRGAALRRFRNYRGFAMSKWDVHAQCRYSIVMENSISPLYWSEKVADALLGFSLPLYHGCPNLSAYLPEASFLPIDIGRTDVIDTIRATLKADPYEDRLPAIQQARRRLLDHENLYAFLDRELNNVAP